MDPFTQVQFITHLYYYFLCGYIDKRRLLYIDFVWVFAVMTWLCFGGQNLINRTKQRNEQLKAKMGYQGLSKTLGDLPSTPAKTAPLREEVTLMSKAVLVSDKENGVKEDTDGGLEENFSFAPPLTSTRCSTGRSMLFLLKQSL